MSPRALAATKRTVNAVRRADRLPRDISGRPPSRVAPSRRSTSSNGTATVPIKITAKTNYNTYTADVYANGTDKDPSEEDATIRVLDIATTETIPNDTILMATPLPWPDIDDNTKRKTYLTIDPARSY